MSLSEERSEFSQDLCHLLQWCTIQGGFSSAYLDEVKRTPEQQKIYFDSGRSKTMDSQHLKGLAGDVVFFKDGQCVNLMPTEQAWSIIAPVGHYWESLAPDNRWGGNFDKDWSRKDPWVDTPHFERKPEGM